MLNQHHIKIILCKWQREFMYEHSGRNTTIYIIFSRLALARCLYVCRSLFSPFCAVRLPQLYTLLVQIIIIHKTRNAFDDGSF